jgi:hypothetical protein
MDIKKILRPLSFLLVMTTSIANAELIKTDVFTAGDNLAFVDTNTGIEWGTGAMNYQIGAGHTMSQVVSDPTLIAPGWRLPTDSELVQFFSTYVTSTPYAVTFLSTDGNIYNSNNSFTDIYDLVKLFLPRAVWNASLSFNHVNNGQVRRSFMSLQGLNGSVQATPYNYNAGSFLYVSDGGTTLSSQLDPSINANNANNIPIAFVSLLPLMVMLGFRRKSKHA